MKTITVLKQNFLQDEGSKLFPGKKIFFWIRANLESLSSFVCEKFTPSLSYKSFFVCISDSFTKKWGKENERKNILHRTTRVIKIYQMHKSAHQKGHKNNFSF